MPKSNQVKFCTTFLTLSWDMHIQNNITAMTFQDDIQHTVTKKSIFLNDLSSFCTKTSVSK